MRRSGLYDKLSGYDLIIFDMDGTLYFQRIMQIRMALRLIKNVFTSRQGLRDLFVILKYRRMREEWDSLNSMDDERLYSALAGDRGLTADEVRGIIRKWMFTDPMDVVRECRDEVLLRIMERLLSEGKRICIYSDYPTEDKCQALGLGTGIAQYYCGKDGIRTLKPNPSALFYILNEYSDIRKSSVIMVGDRADRDKAAADNAGIDSLILARYRILRSILQENRFQL